MSIHRALPIVALTSFVAVTGHAEDNWPKFRGPQGTGVASESSPPDTWTTTKNVAWVRDIPGRGWSSPIVWGDRIFVTTAISTDGAFKEPSTGIYGNDYVAELADQGLSDDEIMARVVSRDIELAKETESIRYMLYALDAASGEVVWKQEAHRGKPFGGRHRKNTYASETPVTDGEHVYVYFGNVGLYAYTMKGELAWKKQWTPQPIYLDFGTASSPAVHGNRVYVQHDNQEESFLAAVDKKTGEEIFHTTRDFGNPMIRSGWASPFVWEHPGRTEVIAVGLGLAVSYDEESATSCGGFPVSPDKRPRRLSLATACCSSPPARKASPTGPCSRSSPAAAVTSRSLKAKKPTSSSRGVNLASPRTRRHRSS